MKKLDDNQNPLNVNLMNSLREKAINKNEGGTASKWDIDDYELHTHPDLVEKFKKVADLPKENGGILH